MESQGRLLVVDDEKVALKNLEHVLKKAGYQVSGASSGQAALALIGRESFDVVLTDLRMEKVDGMQVLKAAREANAETEVVVVTGYATVDSAVEAMRAGAFSYVAKPYRLDEVRRVVAEALDRVRRRRQLSSLAEAKAGEEAFITAVPLVRRLLQTAAQVAPLDCPVLIVGEAGSGRRALARFLHQTGAHPEASFQLVRCTAHDEAALEALLFGRERQLEGTRLIEEVEALPPALQARLALALDGEEGGAAARVVAVTNADLDDFAKAGRFRPDLLLRLKVVTLTLPSLAQRREDIPALALHFLARAAAETGRPIAAISDDALELLAGYDYPGNVRELDTIVRGAAAVCDGATIEARHLPPSIRSASAQARSNRLQTLEEREREYILWVLEEVGGNQTVAARVLGIDRASLWRKLKRYEAEAGG
ncbi:sigma-54 dependent transcriptional regulator [Magnetospirillum sp. UT-4]|uniref:sigma-54-dependent transcriptional regulator n=1 Tax=Magnetospirillum sp. UT-4 TaxID=2681467 RepID=UPI0013824E43|nr:sigma-54 dependent transcriptional regulator [Magnetospirillum sp. UT-4]CAA7611714.1 Two component, sigma54 specific, transcriptional regulator, Fis family [Magnetospirillum sp. UT-4]